MSFSEVVLSALILGISAQISLRGWARTHASALAAVERDQQLLAMDRRLLVRQRLLSLGTPVDGSCRFQPAGVQQILAEAPLASGVTEQLELRPDLQGLWLTLKAGGTAPSLHRRRLFTPAGLGLCRPEGA